MWGNRTGLTKCNTKRKKKAEANKSWTMGIGNKKEVKTQNTHSFPLIFAFESRYLKADIYSTLP